MADSTHPQSPVPEAAVESAAESLWNETEFEQPSGPEPDGWCPPGHDVHQEPPKEPDLWETVLGEGRYPASVEETREEARKMLAAAYPAIQAQVRAEERERQVRLLDALLIICLGWESGPLDSLLDQLGREVDGNQMAAPLESATERLFAEKLVANRRDITDEVETAPTKAGEEFVTAALRAAISDTEEEQ
jgi:hypothetical protein